MRDELVTTKERLKWWINACLQCDVIAFDTETTGLHVVRGEDELVGVSLAISVDQGCYIPVGHTTGEKQLNLDYVLNALAPLLEDARTVKVAHNYAFDVNVMACYGVDIKGYEDTQLMSYALDGKKDIARGHSFDALCKHYFNHDTIKFDDVVIPALNIHTFADVRLVNASFYASEDARWTLRLYHHLRGLLAAETTTAPMPTLLDVYHDVDAPLARVTADMTRRGVAVDLDRIADLDSQFRARMVAAQEGAWDAAGIEFNLGSSKQIATVLYDELGLDQRAVTESGAGKTDKDTLDLLVNDHDCVRHIMEYKKLAKLIGDITEKWPRLVSRVTGRIHGSFNLTSTNTRRLSASDPNEQNVPTRSTEGKMIRECIVAPPGRRLVCVDASQIEYRLLAHRCGSRAMQRMFIDGHDFHAAMAARVLGGDWTEYLDTPERSTFKNVNFATIYGAGPRKIASMCKISEKEAYRILDDYAAEFPEVDDWKRDTIEFGRAHGYVETLFGGRVHVPFIRWSDKGLQKMGERQAVNGEIQGTAADIIRIAMRRVDDALRDYRNAWLLLQVHDELVVECDEEDADEILSLAKQTIETCTSHLIDWKVPLLSEGKHGQSWGDAK